MRWEWHTPQPAAVQMPSELRRWYRAWQARLRFSQLWATKIARSRRWIAWPEWARPGWDGIFWLLRTSRSCVAIQGLRHCAEKSGCPNTRSLPARRRGASSTDVAIRAATLRSALLPKASSGQASTAARSSAIVSSLGFAQAAEVFGYGVAVTLRNALGGAGADLAVGPVEFAAELQLELLDVREQLG